MSDVKKRGTIFQLKPDPPCECSSDENVYAAAKLMFDQGIHCVLVKDKGETVGLFTAKDLACKVVGERMDPNSTKVSDIMTRTPLFLHMDTPMTEALEIMVKRGIRHLPLLDDEGAIKGVLDITRCFYQAMTRLDKISYNAKKLNQVLKDVAEDYAEIKSAQAQTIIDDIKRLKNLIEVPTLHSIVQGSKPAVYVDSHSTVTRAAELMIENSTTAILVNDGTSKPKKVIGIFTSKDVCFRVLAKGYNPDTCTVARVLTSSPEFANSNVNISDALRLMFQGHFLNLPVTDVVTGDIIGIVSVLQLTYAALSQLGKRDDLSKESFEKTMLEEVTNRLTDDETPVWESFWNSVDKSTDDIQSLESSITGKPISPAHSRSQTPHLSRHTSLNQLMMSTSRRTSFNQRRHSEDNETFDALNKFKRAKSSDSLARSSTVFTRTKTIYFKIKQIDHSRNYKISISLFDGTLTKDSSDILELLKLEIEGKIDIGSADQKLYYQDIEQDKMVPIDDGIALTNAIEHHKSHNSKYVEVTVKKNVSSWFESVYSLWNVIRLNAKQFFYESAGFPSAIAILSVGIIVGYTISKR